jgi:hypothetical protein
MRTIARVTITAREKVLRGSWVAPGTDGAAGSLLLRGGTLDGATDSLLPMSMRALRL